MTLKIDFKEKCIMKICGEYDLIVRNGCYVLGKARTRRDGRIEHDHCTY